MTTLIKIDKDEPAAIRAFYHADHIIRIRGYVLHTSIYIPCTCYQQTDKGCIQYKHTMTDCLSDVPIIPSRHARHDGIVLFPSATWCPPDNPLQKRPDRRTKIDGQTIERQDIYASLFDGQTISMFVRMHS